MERGMLLIPILLLVLTVLAWVTAPCGATKVIPTVVKKSKNHEGWVCIQVTRGQTTPRPSVRRPISSDRQHRRNAKRRQRRLKDDTGKDLEGRFALGSQRRQQESTHNTKKSDSTSTDYMLWRKEKLSSQNALESENGEPHKVIRDNVPAKSSSSNSSKMEVNIFIPVSNSEEATNLSSETFAKNGNPLSPLDAQPSKPGILKGDTKQKNKLQEETRRKSLSTLQFPSTSFLEGSNQSTSSLDRQIPDQNNSESTRSHHSPYRLPPSNRRHSLLRPAEDTMLAAKRVVKYKRRPLVEVSLYVVSQSKRVQYTVGSAVVDTRLLADGLHTLHFKHAIIDNQHKLLVDVDGNESPFRALSVREYGVGQYYRDEVQVKVQGPVSFVANSPCEDSRTETGNNTNSTSNRSDGDASDNTQIDFPAETPTSEATTAPDLPSRLPTTIFNNVVLRDESLVYVIILNSTIYDSDIKLSFINNSRLINTTVDNSQVIIANIVDSTLLNSSLHNVTLDNCILGNSRTFNSVLKNTTFYDDSSHNNPPPVQTNSSVPPYLLSEDLAIVDGSDEGEGSPDKPSSGSLTTTMMAFGILGLIALAVVIVGVVAVIARHISKKRKEMLLVRSAVMGNVKSW